MALTTEKSHSKIEKVIREIPPLRELRYFIKNSKMNEKELLTMKVVLDILDAYLRQNDGPLFKTYRKRFIPVALDFYERIDNDEVIKINT
eukprot:CAMPEP_0202960140 /NCGR_PEP_ID=MMETSP1396-20130829/4283_1 /ASSEMBLY_ACC=CAM_ASM_000872 /TAXON_ID= /ORGANISM="Pseudokeronopsis sp., Strain Brazil" /LENGTH=89 /DNA_ID=CAMNT_0049679141 /DNA_START=905 /DNA_END=1174 /DNA_ORIENTATION=-